MAEQQYIPKPHGRPSAWSQELEDKVIDMLSEYSMVYTCKQLGISRQTIYTWIDTRNGFLDKYARATSERADYKAEEIDRIAYDVLDGRYDANSGRVAIDALKWTASKLKPKAYGDRQVIDVTGNVTHASLSDDDLSRRLLELRTAHEIASKT
jgi:hypothetical protein